MTVQWHNRSRVLVVGTTDDYIDWIRKSCPGQAVFLTAPAIRRQSAFETPRSKEEVLADLDNVGQAKAAVADHLDRFGLTLTGVACFDCERMVLASDLGKAFGLPYPDRTAIENARDKYRSKEIWQARGVNCPRVVGIRRPEDAAAFLETIKGPIVLKPVSGSGSELVFNCRTTEACAKAFAAINDGLSRRSENPLFRKNREDLMVAEEMIEGPEFSCDFMVEEDRVDIIRVCRKIKYRSHPFGTIAGYQLLADPGAALDMAVLETALFRGAVSLGITRGICMADFIRKGKQTVSLIEMTPRPGGDCLPHLIRDGAGIDMLALTLDAARGIPRSVNGRVPVQPLIGVRIFAPGAGVLRQVDTSGLAQDPRVRAVQINRSAGHVITMPPEDYDSWILGHMILSPDGRGFPETQSRLMSYRINVEVA